MIWAIDNVVSLSIPKVNLTTLHMIIIKLHLCGFTYLR